MEATVAAGMVHSERASRWRTENLVTVSVVAALLLMLAVCWSTARAVRHYVDASDWVARTYSVMATIEQTSARLTEADSSVRAYVVTGDTSFIQQRDDAISDLESAEQDLKQQLADSPPQLARIGRLERLIEEERQAIDEALVARQTQGFEAAQSSIAATARAPHASELRDVLAQLLQAERDLLRDRQQQTRLSTRNLFLYGTVLVLLISITVAVGLWVLRRELTSRRKLLQRVALNEQFLDSIVEHIPSMLFVKDAANLRYLRLNRAGEDLLGVNRTQILGKNAYDVYPTHEAESFIQADRRVLATGGVLDVPAESFRTRKYGERVLHTRKVVISDPQGTPTYLLGICEDITERVLSERHIHELNAQLERQKTELEATNKDLESFSYSVSHDLRAPLRAVDSFALMLEEDYGSRLDDEARRYIRVIREGAQKMGNLIDDLLTFSRFGRLNLRLASVNMTGLARSTAEELLALAPASAPVVTVHDLPAAKGDASVLTQVWSNLIGNAIKYSSRHPQPQIDVSGEISGQEAIYHVRDNGAGFDMRYYNKLFGVFQRLHRTEEFAGTGVGLAIVHRIVTRHGGRVWAEGTPDVGAVFHFSLPQGDSA